MVSLFHFQTTTTISTTTTPTSSSTTSATLREPEANDLVRQILEDTPVHDEASNLLKDGDIRLINGRSEREVSIYVHTL